MKKIIPIIVLIIGFASCDKIDKPYRNIEEPQPFACDTPSFPAITLSDVIQKYLLEDYTGHKCNNCPKAHTIAAEIKAQMKDTLVVIGIHAGSLSVPDTKPIEGCSSTYSADYRTEAGTTYNQEFKIPGYPAGMINRIDKKVWITPAQWKLCFDTLTRKAPTIGLQVIADYNTEYNSACVFVNTTLFSNTSANLRLCVLLTEDKIISPQKDAVLKDICEYEHSHVLRRAVNHPWGDNLNLSSNGESLIKSYSFSFDGTTWKKENCHLVAFVYDDNTKEIIQVEEIKFIP